MISYAHLFVFFVFMGITIATSYFSWVALKYVNKNDGTKLPAFLFAFISGVSFTAAIIVFTL